MSAESVLVFGYSDNPDRYSYMAYQLLKDFHHKVTTFNPRVDNPANLPKQFDTITLYVNPSIQEKFEELILSLQFKRAIFNPGTENLALETKLRDKGVDVVVGCTLVMLRTNQY